MSSDFPDIDFNRPFIAGDEFANMQDAIARLHLSGDGHYTSLCARELEAITGARKALLTTSCTHALEMAALLLDLGPGDEVILPSFTFVSTANAFVLRGVTPAFCDIDRVTLGLDPEQVERAIGPRTRAIVVVHYAGVAVDMDPILEVAAAHGVVVIEDNAHGLGGTYRGRPLGSIGALATQSFHETKNVHCGEGGALLVNDDRFRGRAEILREKGTDRSAFFRGEVDKYSWVDVGSSYLPSELLAAFLWAQLSSFDRIQERRTEVWEAYARQLPDWAAPHGVGLPNVPADRGHPAHLFYLLMPSLEVRSRFIAHNRANGVHTPFHYVPLHSAPMGRRLTQADSDTCPVTTDIAGRLVRLPLYAGLDDTAVSRVLESVMSFKC